MRFKEYESAGEILKIRLQPLEVRGLNPDVEGVIQNAPKYMPPLGTGVLSFGLVAIPVRIFTATKSENVSFHSAA